MPIETPEQTRAEKTFPSVLPKEGIGLCLSGGGFRAMLFHTGALWRMNELGLLTSLDRISSVSGGSITAATLGVKWATLNFDPVTGIAANFVDQVVWPIREFAAQPIDVICGLVGITTPLISAGALVSKAYDMFLFKGATLQDLPDSPRFVINASNLQSGALWRFQKPYMRDWKVGEVRNPHVKLADAVAASSAFPPVFSPFKLRLNASDFTPDSGDRYQREPYTTKVHLGDGGIYDNLGLETVFKRYQTVFVSDGGKAFEAKAKPPVTWGRHLLRVLNTIDNQVGSLRVRDLVDAYRLREALIADGNLPQSPTVRYCSRQGAYWGIGLDLASFPAAGKLPFPVEKSKIMAETPTRLYGLPVWHQDRLINWGYAVCDAALRSYCLTGSVPPPAFPYPDSAAG
tara:strand:- start:5753 stop:6958 length:1206 start_codon:yes stop_codon:yes gene_type:complete